MSGAFGTERILDAFLAPEADRLPDRVIEAALADIARTPQRRALRVPWRFPPMSALSRATGIAAVALVAAIGAGGLIYLNSPGGSGGRPTPSPTQGAAAPSDEPSAAPTTATTPQPTWDGQFQMYTSEVYGLTIPYPSGWSVDQRAARPGAEEVFVNHEEVDGDSIAIFVFQVPAPEGSDLGTWEGLEAVVQGLCEQAGPPDIPCPSFGEPITPMCVGEEDCAPAVIALVSSEKTPSAYVPDPGEGVVTVYAIGREDDFPPAQRYGGTVALLKALLAELDIREPEAGETPS